jgi:N6-adenosine-specific RNA methylase IME4
MMSSSDLDDLAADISQRGQIHPILITSDDLVLDGRNRLEACRRAGVEPYTLIWDGDGDPFASPTAFVLSANLRRRHLNESQRALAAAEALPLFEAEARARQKATLKRGAAPVSAPVRSREVAEPRPQKKGKAAAAAAEAMGARTRSVERAKAVLTKRPELRDQIRDAKITLKQAEKAIRKEEQLKNVLEYVPPKGTYAVIVADVPWQYEDQLDGSDQARGGTPYPPMPLDEICKLKPPAAPDCALWFWATNAHLIDGSVARVLEAWGFEPKTLLTWRKVDKAGNDRLGSGHYLRNTTEHVVLAVRGKPVVRGSDQPTIFDAPRTSRHSEKPPQAYEIFERVTPCDPSARIELFAVTPRAGWVTSGSEQQAKERVKLSAGDLARLEALVRPEADVDPIGAPDLLAAAKRGPARVERAAFSLITWFRTNGELPRVAAGNGRTGRYVVDRRGRSFHWALVVDAEGNAVRGWPESPAFASLEAAKDDAEAIEQTRCATLPVVPAMLEPRQAPKCGEVDGHTGPKNGPCLLDAGHGGAHSNGRRTWPGKKLRGKPRRPNMQVRDV